MQRSSYIRRGLSNVPLAPHRSLLPVHRNASNMVAISKGDKVLVTGASGYIAAHTVKAFLDAGYPVRGTVRSKAKGEYLVNLFKGQPFEYVIVGDIAEDGAFDEAVKGVQGVAHTASPFHFNAEDPEELIKPAVNGTLGVLYSLKKNNPDVKRVVITSSVAAIMNATVEKPHVYTEKEWNTHSSKEIEEKGKAAEAGDKYRASKTLAEQAFWKFIEDEKPSWDGATINPPLVLGPVIHQVDKPESLNTSVGVFFQWLNGTKTEKDLPAAGFNYVDVRDAALGHVLALTVPEAGGERFITGNGPTSGNDYVLAINKTFPGLISAKGDPSIKEKIDKAENVFDGSKATRVLGLHYRPLEATLSEMAKDLKGKFLS